jgi:hypothetical protein
MARRLQRQGPRQQRLPRRRRRRRRHYQRGRIAQPRQTESHRQHLNHHSMCSQSRSPSKLSPRQRRHRGLSAQKRRQRSGGPRDQGWTRLRRSRWRRRRPIMRCPRLRRKRKRKRAPGPGGGHRSPTRRRHLRHHRRRLQPQQRHRMLWRLPDGRTKRRRPETTITARHGIKSPHHILQTTCSRRWSGKSSSRS